jgi:hypothetical protein
MNRLQPETKPRLKKVAWFWRCSDKHSISYAITPEEAYKRWLGVKVPPPKEANNPIKDA